MTNYLIKRDKLYELLLNTDCRIVNESLASLTKGYILSSINIVSPREQHHFYLCQILTTNESTLPATPPAYPPTNKVMGHCCHGRSQSKGIGITPNQQQPNVNKTDDRTGCLNIVRYILCWWNRSVKFSNCNSYKTSNGVKINCDKCNAKHNVLKESLYTGAPNNIRVANNGTDKRKLTSMLDPTNNGIFVSLDFLVVFLANK